MTLPTIDQLRQTRVYQQSLPEQRQKMESRLDADTRAAQGGAGTVLPTSPQQPVGQQHVDVSFGLPSEAVYRAAEQRQPRPAALLPKDPATFAADQQAAKQPERTLLGTAGDIGVTALKGAVGLPQAFVGLADIPTGGRVGRGLEKIGYRPGETQEILSGWYSPAQQYAERQVQEAEGFIPTLKAAARHPSTIARAVSESAPLMLGGAGIARGILSKAPAMMARIAPVFGMSAEALAGAIGEGAIGAGAMAESIREQTENRLLSPKQAAAAVGAGVGTALFSAAGGRLAQKLGIDDIDTMLAGGRFRKPDQVAKAIVAGGISEGLFEEMPQEMQETVWQNAATGRPLLEGAAEAGAQALLAGAAMGSGINIISGAAGQERRIDEQGDTTTAETRPTNQSPVTDISTASEMIETVINGLNTGQLKPQDLAQAEVINSVREQMRTVTESPSPEVQEVVAQNRDVLERIGLLTPDTGGNAQQPTSGAEIDQAGQFEGGEPSKVAPETGFRETQTDFQETGEPQFSEEAALARAQAILPKDRTKEEAQLVKDYQEKIDAEELAIRRARAIDDQYRTPEEREIVRAAEQREQEGYAKEELKAGQTAQAAEEAGAQSGKGKLPPVGSLAGVVDFKNTSLDELQGIVRKVQEAPFEQLSDQEKRVAEAIGTQGAPVVQVAPEGVQAAPGKAAQPVQKGQVVPRLPEAEAVTGQMQGDMDGEIKSPYGDKYEKVNALSELFTGETVQTPDGEGVVVKKPFGRVSVELNDGTITTYSVGDLGVKKTTLTNKQKQLLDAESRMYKRDISNTKKFARIGGQGEEITSKTLRGMGMEHAKIKRHIIQGDSLSPVPGGLTPAELENKKEKLSKNYIGKNVITPFGKGVISGHAYGKIKVKLDNGDLKTFTKDDVKTGVNKLTDEKISPNFYSRMREISATTTDGVKIGSRKKNKEVQPDDAGQGRKGGVGSRKVATGEFENKRAVETALRRGEEVPKEVMEQYPELAPASPEDISGKKGVTERLGSIMREEGKGKAGVRRELGGYRFDPKKFHKQRRDPEKLRLLTDNPEYKKILPENTEKIISEAAKIKQQVNDAETSLEDNKAHLMRFFDKEGVEEFRVTHNGLEYKLTKPVGGETEVLTPEGKDAKEEIYKDYQESGKLKYIAVKGVGLTIQPKKTPVSKVAPYATKTFEQAAIEHIDFVAELAEANEKETIIKASILDQIAEKLPNNGMDHVFRNKEADTAFNIRRNRRFDYFIHPENGAEFDRIKALRDDAFYSGNKKDQNTYEKQLKELIDPDIKKEVEKKVEALKKAPGTGKKQPKELGSFGVRPMASRGFKGKGAMGKKEEARAAAEAELDKILKSISGTPLPKGQRADIIAELSGQFDRGVLAQQKRGVFEVVSPEKAAKALQGKTAGIEPKYSEQGPLLEGLTFPDGKVWLVDGNIEKGTVPGVFAHELGVHARKLGFKDEKSFKAILKRVEALSKTDEQVKAARARVPENTPAQIVNEETLAYLVSDAPQHGLVKRLVAAIKKFLAERGWLRMTLDKLTPADLQALAQSAVRADMSAPAQEARRNTGEWSATDPDIMMSMSAPAQEARRNTENMNATKDGQTSTTSAEAGEKAIRSIMSTLRKVTQKTEEELDKSKAKERKFLDQYRQVVNNQAMPIDESVNLLNGLVRQADIPAGAKQRIGQLIKQITAAKRPETQRKRLNIALEKLEADISRRLRSQIMAQVKRAAGPKREGVIKRGRFWHEQEKDITAIREIVHNMSPEQATEAIDRIESRLDGLHDRLKGAAPENAETISNQITDAELRLHHLRTFGGLKDKSLNQLLDAKYQIEELRRLGRSKLRAVKDAWQQEVDRKTNWLAQEITGQDNPRPETVAQKNRRKQKEKSLVGKAKGAYQAVENSIQSFEHLLDRITIKSGKKIFQSRAVKELGSMAHSATRGAERYNRETTDQMLAKGLEIFGVKKGSTLTKRLQKLAKKTGKIKVAGDTLQLSPMEAAYFYNVRKAQSSEKLFHKMGFTPETWSGIDSLMTKELKAWADYLHDDLLADALQGEKEAYRAVNGVDRVPVGLFRDNQTDISVMNLNSAIMNRIFDANHYRAWAVPSKTFNDLFSVPETRGYIEQYAGTSTLKALDKFLEDFAKTPRELRGDMAWMDKLRSNVVMSMIGANPTTFFKQLTSIPAYAADIPTHAFVKNFAHGLGNFGKVRRMIKDSQMAKERFGAGFDRDIHEASRATAEQIIGGKVTRVRDVLMAMTKLGDQAAIYTGYTVYRYHYDKNKSKGHKEAHRIGIEEFELATERTQQAAAVKDLGSFQRGSSLQKLFTMYMTSPAAYTRQTMAALRHFPTDPAGSSKRLLLFNVMLPMMFQAVASGMLGAGGGDEEEWEDFWQKEMRAVALGPFLGIPIARDIAAGVWESAMGSWYGSDIQHSPVTETTKSLTQAIFQFSKGVREFDDEAIDRAKKDFFDFLGYMSGLPTRPGRRLWEGWEDFFSGDTEHPLLAATGYSRAVRNEKYLGD